MFLNEDRNRYYGKRVGDKVRLIVNGQVAVEGEVVQLGPMDNNRIQVKDANGEIVPCVAEWCEIVRKVDEIPRGARKATINNNQYQVDELLEGFTINQKPSSNVMFFGDNGTDVFVQFKSGCYIYKGVLKEHIEQMHQADSIGRFVSFLGKIYQYEPVQYPLVTPIHEPAKQ